MKPIELKVARIGNSRGVRIPSATLKRYGIGGSVVMEERSDGILLRTSSTAIPKLSWDETARAMVEASEQWEQWDSTVADGLEDVPWTPALLRRVAEPTPARGPRGPRGRRR